MKKIIFALAAFITMPAMAQEEELTDIGTTYEPRLTISSYGELGVSSRNYTGDRFATAEGAEDTKSTAFSVPTLGVRLDYKVNKSITFTGDLKYVNEAGFKLNDLTINYSFCPEFNISGGIFTLPIGYSNTDYRCTDHFTIGYPEGERSIIPCPMTECGLSLGGKFCFGLDYKASVSTGMNASKFTAEGFIKEANQGFGDDEGNLSSPAATLRLGYSGLKGFQIGAGIYYCSNTVQNMATYSDFKSFFTPERKVPLTIYFADAQYENKWFAIHGSYLEGNVGNSAFLTSYLKGGDYDFTENMENIAKIARTYMGEVGINVKNIFYPTSKGPELIPFAHYEYYNSQEQEQAKGVLMNPKGKVTLLSFGLNWKIANKVMVKCNYTTRKIGDSAYNFRSMNEVNLGIAYDISLLEL